jgi:VanZ family protein
MAVLPRARVLLLVLFAGLAVYVSLIPFDFTAATDSRPIELRGVVSAMPVSRTDLAGNVLLFVPIGYLLSAWVERSGTRLSLIRQASVVLAACMVFSICLETAQAFLPTRIASILDVAAQSVGAAAGLTLRMWFGARLSALAGEARALQLAPKLYLATFLAAEWLPLDVTLSPADLAAKYRRADIAPGLAAPGTSADEMWIWIMRAALAAPLGVIAWQRANRAGRRWIFSRALMTSSVFLVVVEVGQVFVLSRRAASTDVISALAGATVGAIAAALTWRDESARHDRPPDTRNPWKDQTDRRIGEIIRDRSG